MPTAPLGRGAAGPYVFVDFAVWSNADDKAASLDGKKHVAFPPLT